MLQAGDHRRYRRAARQETDAQGLVIEVRTRNVAMNSGLRSLGHQVARTPKQVSRLPVLTAGAKRTFEAHWDPQTVARCGWSQWAHAAPTTWSWRLNLGTDGRHVASPSRRGARTGGDAVSQRALRAAACAGCAGAEGSHLHLKSAVLLHERHPSLVEPGA